MKCIVLFILLVIAVPVKAQFVDDFSDGNLTADPIWAGNAEHFRINAENQLQLYTSGAGTAVLTTESHLIDSTLWQFWIKLGFSPSTNNYARVYLTSDQPDLTGSLNGYYLQFGESGSGDAIELFCQQGLEIQSVCRGREGAIASPFSMKIKVTCLQNGIWTIYTAADGSPFYQQEASGSDMPVAESAFFGLLCTFTGSNSQKFFFDDFLVLKIEKDTVPPQVDRVVAVAADHLEIRFSEQVEEQDATDPGHYFVESSDAIPITASMNDPDPCTVHLYFAGMFVNGTSDKLHIMNIHDLADNLLPEAVVPFTYYIPQAYDILINEIMADPEPAIGLPPMEYIELFNASPWSISMKNWTLRIADDSKTLPEASIPAGDYLILSKDLSFTEFAQSVPLFTSAYSLSNGGASLALFNEQAQLIHAVDYSSAWYREEWKTEGGWSLEMIDPLNPCGEATNWTASVAPSGGTPGEENSVMGINPDTVGPRLSAIGVEAGNVILLGFSEKMDSTLLLDPMHYNLEPGIGNPLKVWSGNDSYRALWMEFPVPMAPATSYQLAVRAPLSDCTGNPLKPGSWLPLGMPVEIGYLDLVINEILLDPPELGVDFIELYNRSNQFIDLKTIVLAQLDTMNHFLLSAKPVTDKSFILPPEKYIVLTPDPSWVITTYHCPDPDAFIRMSSWISFNKESSVIVIARRHDEMIIDCVHYKESFHFDLISHPEGISLERIHFDRPSDDPTNWHSSSQPAGFATPGYQNSQFGNSFQVSDSWLTIDPKLFTPNNDGSSDVVTLYCAADQPGLVINIAVFDPWGTCIRHLVTNSLMGFENTYSWDGKNDDGMIMYSGIYVIWAQLFDLKGMTRVAKRPCVLIGQDVK